MARFDVQKLEKQYLNNGSNKNWVGIIELLRIQGIYLGENIRAFFIIAEFLWDLHRGR